MGPWRQTTTLVNFHLLLGLLKLLQGLGEGRNTMKSNRQPREEEQCPQTCSKLLTNCFLNLKVKLAKCPLRGICPPALVVQEELRPGMESAQGQAEGGEHPGPCAHFVTPPPILCTCSDGVFLAMHVCMSMYEINIFS